LKFKHLEDSQETYSQHFVWAVKSGLLMIWTGLASIIHGILPPLFPFKSAKTVIDLYYERLHTHKNSQYQAYIKKVQDEQKTKRSELTKNIV
jgi:hypothetical protein